MDWSSRGKRIRQIKEILLQDSINYAELIKQAPTDILQKFDGYPLCESTWIMIQDAMYEQLAMEEGTDEQSTNRT